MRLTEDDIDDVVLTHPSLLREIDAARREHEAKGGVSLEEARRKLKRGRFAARKSSSRQSRG